MHSKQQFQNFLSRTISASTTAALAIAIVFVLMVVATQSAQAQTYQVIYNFTGGGDGGGPSGGLSTDVGSLYGTTRYGGIEDRGTAFRLTNSDSGWVLTTLHSFLGSRHRDGTLPVARVIFGPDGGLYGTTEFGGAGRNTCGCGTVFEVKPASWLVWTETVIHHFSGGSDGYEPLSEVVFDPAGNLYGTTVDGGEHAWGNVYELTPSNNGGWTESELYSFTGGSDGGDPWWGGVIVDGAGNLYGTTVYGGAYNFGAVFQLTPSGRGWTESVLYSFQNGGDGLRPYGGLILDQLGNLYGTTTYGGSGGGGTVFKLTPANGNWTFTLIYSLEGGAYGSQSKLAMDAVGNLYGTTNVDGLYGHGRVFKLTHGGGGWTYISLHDFTGGSDGGTPNGPSLDASGNLYGTASLGGAYGAGVIWEIRR
jgi:uncharacterized repeat protein (TIGR03803 family)